MILIPSCRVCLVALSVAAVNAPAATETTDVERLAEVFRPFQVGLVALAPDGSHVAYALRRNQDLSLAVMDVEHPSPPILTRVEAGAWPSVQWGDPPVSVEISFLRWISPDRIIYATNFSRVFGVDANGRNARELANPGGDPDRLAMDNARAASAQRKAQLSGMAQGTLGPAVDLSGTVIPRHVRVAALPAGDRRHMVVEAVGPPSTSLFRVDVATGASEETFNGRVNDLLTDQEGNPRISAVRLQRETSVHLSYSGARKGVLGPVWAELDRVAGPAVRAPFEMSAQTELSERSIALGFDRNPNVLYYASNAGRDTYGVYGIDLTDGRATGLAVEDPRFDLADPSALFPGSVLVFDPHERRLVGVNVPGLEPAVRWLDPGLESVERRLRDLFPGRSVRLADWDEARRRYLVFVASNADPGRYYLYSPSDENLVLLLRRAPWIGADEPNSTVPFSFPSPAGVELTGYLTLPRHPRISPAALIAFCHDGPWMHDGPGFNRDVQALASMGFAVLQVNYRGSSGLGARFREDGQRDPGSRPAGDVLAAVDWAAGRPGVDGKRISVFGLGFGGYVALRAVQLRPGRFRSAIVVDPPTDLGAWIEDDANPAIHQMDTADAERAMSASIARHSHGTFGETFQDVRTDLNAANDVARAQLDAKAVDDVRLGRIQYFGTDRGRLDAASPALHPDSIAQPVFIIHEVDSPSVPRWQVTKLRDALASRGVPRAYFEVDRNFFSRGDLEERVRVFHQIEEFLNETIYDFGAHYGDMRIVR